MTLATFTKPHLLPVMPKLNIFLGSLFLCIVLLACHKKIYRVNTTYQIPTVNNNVNKKLSGKVVLYLVFVDTRVTHPWTAYDINSTLDSAYKAADWIIKKAAEDSVPLSISIQFHKGDSTIPIEQNLPEGTLSKTLFAVDGLENLDFWADRVAKKAAPALGPDVSRVVATKNVITDRERLIARLRDVNKTDNVVLMYMLNNYHQDEISVALHTGGSAAEYSVVSFKNPAVIAHEFLHLFGALDLYMSPFDRKKKVLKRKIAIMNYAPNEIMAFTDRLIEKLDISPATRYFLGWRPVMDERAKEILFGKKIKLYKY
jgi:hypothetical protein